MSNTMADMNSVCALTRGFSLRRRVAAAAQRVGWQFHHVDNWGALVECLGVHEIPCVVVDFDTVELVGISALDDKTTCLPPMIGAIRKGDVDAALHAVHSGALHVVEKPVSEIALVDNFRAVVEFVKQDVPQVFDRRRFDARYAELTEREGQVLELLLNSTTNHEIARQLETSLRTIEADRAQIMSKLGVGSFVELIRMMSLVQAGHPTRRLRNFADILARQSQPPNSHRVIGS